MPQKPDKPFLKRLFTLQFTRKLILFALAGFSFVLGIFLLLRFFPEKAFEFSSPYFGTIKTSATTASNYLADIEIIGKRVEGQRDTIDAAFANAAGAQRAASNATEQVNLASEQLKIMKTNAAFLLLFAQAYADNRAAFDRLVDMRFSSDSQTAKTANDAVNTIVNLLDINYKVGKNNITANWQGIGIDPNTNSLQQLEQIYPNNAPAIRTHLLNYIAATDRFPKADRLDFVVQELQEDSSLSIENLACEIMNEESKLGFNVLGSHSYLIWWENNKSKYANTNSSAIHP